MNRSIIKAVLVFFFVSQLSVNAQNMASIEAPFGISLAYGFDYHPVWYTQLKPSVGVSFGGGLITGSWYALEYGFAVEQRYYYNIVKRQLQGKNTAHRSADFFSLKPSYAYQFLKSEDKQNNRESHVFYCPVNWGLRRAMGKRFYFDGSIGVGPAYSTYHNSWKALVNLYVGIGLKLF